MANDAPLDGEAFADLRQVDFGGLPARVTREWRWSRWQSLGAAPVPTVFEEEQWVTTDLYNEMKASHALFARQIQVETCEPSVDAAAFALVAPPEAGPVGRISNPDTGGMRVVDGRGIRARNASSDQFVSGVVAVAAGDELAPGPGGSSSAGWLLLFAGGACLALFGVRILPNQKRKL